MPNPRATARHEPVTGTQYSVMPALWTAGSPVRGAVGAGRPSRVASSCSASVIASSLPWWRSKAATAPAGYARRAWLRVAVSRVGEGGVEHVP